MQSASLEIILPIISLPFLLAAYWRLKVKKLASKLSDFGLIEVLEKYNGERTLTINHWAQGITTADPSISQSYWAKVSELIITTCQNKKSPKILMFGLGGNTISQLIQKQNINIHQTIIEIDPVIIEFCRKYFDLDQLSNAKIINQDAYKLIASRQFKNESFDVIVVDISTGNPPLVDPKSAMPSFVKQISKLLKKDGKIIFNRHADTAIIRLENEVLRSHLQKSFKKIASIKTFDPRGYKNEIVICLNG